MSTSNDPADFAISQQVKWVLDRLHPRQTWALKELLRETFTPHCSAGQVTDEMQDFLLRGVVRMMLEQGQGGESIESLKTYDWNEITEKIRFRITELTQEQKTALAEKYTLSRSECRH